MEFGGSHFPLPTTVKFFCELWMGLGGPSRSEHDPVQDLFRMSLSGVGWESNHWRDTNDFMRLTTELRGCARQLWLSRPLTTNSRQLTSQRPRVHRRLPSFGHPNVVSLPQHLPATPLSCPAVERKAPSHS